MENNAIDELEMDSNSQKAHLKWRAVNSGIIIRHDNTLVTPSTA